jgi:excinuclease ABC subunit C
MVKRRRKRDRLPMPPHRRREDQEAPPELLPDRPQAAADSGAGRAAESPEVRDEGSRPRGSASRTRPARPPISIAPKDWRERLEAKLELLPRRSGVYLFRDARGRVIYVGKAKVLHTRVRSYFRGPTPPDERLRRLRARIRLLDYVVTGNEIEALILESHLIKQYSPRFNIQLKDDKKFPYIKLTTGHPFPGMFLTRTVVPDGSRYYGPFTRVKDLRRTLKTLRSVFQLRNCTDRRLLRDERECLQFFIGRCTAPCTHRVTAEEYRAQVEPLQDFLSGKGAEALDRLAERMRGAAEKHRYEEAARLRDGIATLEELMREQRMTPPVESEAELVALASRSNQACAVFLHVQEGKVLGKSHQLLTGVSGASPAEQLRALLLSLFLDAPRVPTRFVAGVEPEDRAGVESALAQRAGHLVRIQVQKRGELHRLLETARENAHLLLEEEELLAARKRARVAREVYELQELLDLAAPPYRIEGYDISNIQGAMPVASIVTFRDGKPLKSGYRRLRMNSPGPDDFAMIEEALRRRLDRVRTGGEEAPDLILVDGGAGQVGRARSVLEESGFAHLPLLGLAKKEEEIVLPRGGRPIRLPRSSGALQLLQRVRDEAHRFAVQYHRKLRGRAQQASRLDSIPGIGPARRRELLRRFGSVEGIRRAQEKELAAIRGIGPRTARAVLEALGESDSRGRAERDRPAGAS